ncbi:MAG: hypothetical protein C0453_10990 [Comamonadaceae bacterium]|nr:hypothetical protein [Comamonadaceae bacterium]
MSTIRRFMKTPRAWEALARPDLMGREAHTLLLMANGRRSRLELSTLLGQDIDNLASTLQAGGYLKETELKLPGDAEEESSAGA